MLSLMEGDCLDLMQSIPDKSVDLIICDPPFGTTRNSWDVVIPMDRLWEQWNRIARQKAPVLVFCQLPFLIDVAASNRKNLRYEWIYEKTNATGFLNANRAPMKAHENVLVFYRNAPEYHPQMSSGEAYKKQPGRFTGTNYGKVDHRAITEYSGGRYPTDVIRFANSARTADNGMHPTQKPVPLLEYLIRTYTNEGDVVLDPCMGSGSTGVACVNTCRSFIGIEKDAHYFAAARERIESAAAQERMF